MPYLKTYMLECGFSNRGRPHFKGSTRDAQTHVKEALTLSFVVSREILLTFLQHLLS
jgi:hypothetical protein